MSGSRKLLIFGGLALAAFGMLYGLHYALFIEHPTLDGMGGSLTTAFTAVANRETPKARDALQTYGNTKYNYVRQVDAHSHWIGLAMLMIVFGVVFDQVNLDERIRRWLSILLLAGSILFPFAVLLQTARHGGMFASGLAVISSALVTIALAGIMYGFVRQQA